MTSANVCHAPPRPPSCPLPLVHPLPQLLQAEPKAMGSPWITGGKQWPLGDCPPGRQVSSGGGESIGFCSKAFLVQYTFAGIPELYWAMGARVWVFACLII